MLQSGECMLNKFIRVNEVSKEKEGPEISKQQSQVY